MYPPTTKTKRGRVFPVLFMAAEAGDHQKRIRLLTPVDKQCIHKQMSIVEGKQNWSSKEVQNQILEEIALALRKAIVNTHNRHNPLRMWENAC